MPKTIRKSLPWFALLFLTLFIGISCQKELSYSAGGPGGPGVTQRTTVEGRVTDEAGMPVFGATVKAGISSVVTDKNGLFKIENASFTTSETFVTVTKSGYFKGSRTFFSRENSDNYIKIQLLRKTISDRIPANAGGDVSLNSDKGSIHFEPNSFVTASGASYSGTVMVATQYLDPTRPEIAEQMPGDLRGVSTAGSVVGLRSFGMIGVELLDEAGMPLQLRSGTMANISVKIPASQQSIAPSTIPLWHFNDSTGLWKQEGSATKIGDSYEGNVSHFSFWNCDDPFEYVKIHAKVVNAGGTAVRAAKVQLTNTSGYTVYDYTDNNGYVDGFVPKNETLAIEVLNTCGASVYTGNIGPFTTETTIPNIVVTQNVITLQGTAVNCAGGPVTDGYVQITINGSTEFAAITNGTFNASFISCQGVSTAQVIAIDNAEQKQGLPVNVNISGTVVNAGQLTACGVSSATFFNLTIAGVNLTANTSEYLRQGWKADYGDTLNTDADYVYAAYDSLVAKYIYFGFYRPANYVFTVPGSINGDLYMGYKGINGASEEISLTSLNPLSQSVNFTEYGGLGQFISGNYNGLVVRDIWDSVGATAFTDTVTAVFNFRVRHVTNPF
ncbi:MAG: carboxypeptidase regulatory-like domain-containing protein [Rhizobacter sp.]|nr:carboxypeptidase regulatory-like domain-containing protein [Ferruginibacter sp.]